MAMKPETKAERLLAKRVQLENEIMDIKRKAGLLKLETALEKVKEELLSVMTENKFEQVQGKGYHATLVKQSYGSMLLATMDDFLALDEIPADRAVTPLRSIIRKKYGKFSKGSKSSEIWKRITKPVVVPDKLEEVVSEGLLSVDEIAPAYVDKQKKPYARVFKD